MKKESRANLASVSLTESPGYQWNCVTEKAAFAGRDGAGALVFKNKMWLLGGWNPNDKHYFPRICNTKRPPTESRWV